MTLYIPSFVWAANTDPYVSKRKKMVEEQIIRRGIVDQKVIQSLSNVPRHLFVPTISEDFAYEDHPLPIGHGQTISQPYIVAYMTEALNLSSGDKILEIGTGSGYQAAVLAEIVREVYTIEIVKPLADSAKKQLKDLGYKNIFVKHGDGYQGWVDHAPYDSIIVTAAPEEVPEKLVEQLKVGGKMIVPIGSIHQELYIITRTEEGYDKIKLLPVRFVPMIKTPVK